MSLYPNQIYKIPYKINMKGGYTVFTRRNKVLIPIILVLSMLLFVSPMYAFTNDSISKQDRFEIINTPAFYTIGNPDSEEPCGFKNLSTDELMSITDKEFRKTIKDNIMWAITQLQMEKQFIGTQIHINL